MKNMQIMIKIGKIYYNKIMQKKHYVYILLTERGTLYCGYTDDIEKRYKQHIEGKGAKYTRANKPVKLVYQQVYNTKTEAMREEYRIKHKLTRAQKLKLIGSELNQQDYSQ